METDGCLKLNFQGHIKDFAAQSVLARVTVTGVQKKLSLGIEVIGKDKRLTVVGLWGNFILKPPAEEYCALPENEDTAMRLASVVKIPVVPHAMTRLTSGELAYITRRIDRNDGDRKIAMEFSRCAAHFFFKTSFLGKNSLHQTNVCISIKI